MKIVIVGAGIGGLTTALSLHAAGFTDLHVFEAAREIRELGVGVNLPPHAVRELDELGLGEQLARIGIPTHTLSYYDRQGELIWAEDRGLNAGYRWPQYSIHRGRLQQMLLEAVSERLGPRALCPDHRVVGIVTHETSATVLVSGADAVEPQPHMTDLVIGADGIRSTVRTALYSGQADSATLATNGWVMYRGATSFPSFLGGHTMVIVGDETQRIVVYPIDNQTLNWLMVRPLSAQGSDANPRELGIWNAPANPQRVARLINAWKFDWLDIPALVRATPTAYAYPMADIDPLPRWTFGPVTLLGDAAHAMYPFGSNGASQAILDARILAYELAYHDNPLRGLQAYEAARREAVAKVQQANRRQASDVMARVSELSRANSHGQAMQELKSVEQTYKKLAGFDVDTLNQRPSWDARRRNTPTAA